MIRRRYWLWLLMMLIVPVQAQDIGADAYQRGDYTAAIQHYEGQLAQGVSNRGLHTNLGHAYYQNGQLGYALVHYLEAQQLAPRDGQLQAQIARIRAERLNDTRAERDWLVLMADTTRDLFTLVELGWITFTLWTGSWLLAGLTLRKNSASRRMMLSILTGLLIFILPLFTTRFYVDSQQPVAVVIADRAPIMSGPAADYLPLYTLFEAAEVRVITERDGWLRFRLSDGRVGWIERDNLGYIPPDLG